MMAAPGTGKARNGPAWTVQFSIPLPRSLDTRIYVRLTVQAKATVVFLTTAAADELGTPTPLGSFVYALPDVRAQSPSIVVLTHQLALQKFNPQQPLSTALFVAEPTVEFTSRIARLLAKITGVPAYVGNSVSLANAGLGGTVDEEMEAFKTVVEAVLARLQYPVEPGKEVGHVSDQARDT